MFNFFNRLFKRNSDQAVIPNDIPENNISSVTRTYNEITKGIKQGLLLLPTTILLCILERYLLSLANEINQMESIVVTDDMLTPYNILAFSVLEPIFEELIFRKILLSGIYKSLRCLDVNDSAAKYTSQIAPSMLFAGLHGPGQRLNTFFKGMLYSNNVMEHDGRQWVNMSSHITNNSIATATALLAGALKKA